MLDASVWLAACGSPTGASNTVVRQAVARRWQLFATPYILNETERDLHKLGPSAASEWTALCAVATTKPDVWTIDRPAVFGPSKDRPALFAGLAWADVLLTLDRRDFAGLIGDVVLSPGCYDAGNISRGPDA